MDMIGKKLGLIFLFSLIIFLVFSCASDIGPLADSNNSTSTSPKSLPKSADDLIIVSCRQRPKIKRLGRHATYLTRRRTIRTSAGDCRKINGTIIHSAKLLASWKEEAKTGKPQPVTEVGDIYEQQKDYAKAAKWYKKAADEGYKIAQTRLAYLYESGKGVEKDLLTAMRWDSKAIGESATLGGDSANLVALEALKQEIKVKKRESAQLNQDIVRKRQELGSIQRDLQEQKNNVETQLDGLKLEQEALRNKLNQAKKRQDQAAESQIMNLLAQKDAEISQLRRQIEYLINQAQSNQNELEQLRDRLKGKPILRLAQPQLPKVGGSRLVDTSADIQQQVIGAVVAPAGIKAFTVNESDKRNLLDDVGLFSVPISIKARVVPVKLKATDRLNNSVSLHFKFKPKLKATDSPGDLNFGNYYALIIANENYLNFQDLETPIDDAEKVAEVLHSKYNFFKPKIVRNATRDEIVREISKLGENKKESDNLLIYYAGHGDLDERVSPARGYWLGVDAGKDKITHTNWIPNIVITDFMELTNAKHVLVINDSCYSAAMLRDAETRGVNRLHKDKFKEYQQILKKRSSVIITSGALQPVLDSIDGEHSIFARELINILEENEKILEGQTLFTSLSERVKERTKLISESYGFIEEQRPQYLQNLKAGHNYGDFLFVPETRISSL